MNQTTRWLSLLAGCALFLYGLKMMYGTSDWVIAVLGILIMVFSALGIAKNRGKPQ